MSFLAVTLSQFWLTVQGSLFPWLEQELGELSEQQKQLVAILELLGIERFITTSQGNAGRPQEDRWAIARPFVCKAVYNLGTTRQLLERLACDVSLRRLCGWERQDELPKRGHLLARLRGIYEEPVARTGACGHDRKIRNGSFGGPHFANATAIEARERAAKKVKKVKELPKPKGGRRKKGEAQANH